jgi:hypothetical protein
MKRLFQNSYLLRVPDQSAFIIALFFITGNPAQSLPTCLALGGLGFLLTIMLRGGTDD